MVKRYLALSLMVFLLLFSGRKASLQIGDNVKSSEYFILGPFRGLVCSYRWIQVYRLQRQYRFEEVGKMAIGICRLQPYEEAAWDYLAWNMAFNLFIEAGNQEDVQWNWLSKGLDHLDEGLHWNPQSLRLNLAKAVTLHLRTENRPGMQEHIEAKYGIDAMTLAIRYLKNGKIIERGGLSEIEMALVILRRAHHYDDAIVACAETINRFPQWQNKFKEYQEILEKEKLESGRK